jgi:hypothetical protein
MNQRAFKKSGKPGKPENPKRVMGLQLPHGLELDLQAYCEAMDDAPKSTVIRKALGLYIEAQLAANEGIRSVYETIRKTLKDRESNTVTLHAVEAARRQEDSP